MIAPSFAFAIDFLRGPTTTVPDLALHEDRLRNFDEDDWSAHSGSGALFKVTSDGGMPEQAWWAIEDVVANPMQPSPRVEWIAMDALDYPDPATFMPARR